MGGRRTGGDTREFAGIIVRVPDVVCFATGRGVGLLVTAGFRFVVVEGGGLVPGSGLARAKGLSSSVVIQKAFNKSESQHMDTHQFLVAVGSAGRKNYSQMDRRRMLCRCSGDRPPGCTSV